MDCVCIIEEAVRNQNFLFCFVCVCGRASVFLHVQYICSRRMIGVYIKSLPLPQLGRLWRELDIQLHYVFPSLFFLTCTAILYIDI